MKLSQDTIAIAAGVAAIALAVLFIARKGTGPAIGQAVGEASIGTIVGAGTGVVLGAGDAVGIPRTNMTECEKAIAEGRTWDASFNCPASTFLKHVFS